MSLTRIAAWALFCGGGAAHAQEPAERVVVLRAASDCDGRAIDPAALSAMLAVELVADGVARVANGDAPAGAQILATIALQARCEGVEVEVAVDDRLTEKIVQRTLRMPEAGDSAGARELGLRELAIAIAELLRASWLEVLVVAREATAEVPGELRRSLSARITTPVEAATTIVPSVPPTALPSPPLLYLAIGARWIPTLRTLLGEVSADIGTREDAITWFGGITALQGGSLGAPIDTYIGAALARGGGVGRFVLGARTSMSLAAIAEVGIGWAYGVSVAADRDATGGVALITDALVRWTFDIAGTTWWSFYLQAGAVITGLQATSDDLTGAVAGIRDFTAGAGARLGFSP